MERWKKTALMLALGAFSGIILLVSTKDMSWLIDEIFAIMVSILFFSPVVTALLEGRPPKEWIVVFIIGGFLFIVFSVAYYSSLVEVVELIFVVIFITVLSTIGTWIAQKLMDVVPPN